MTQHVVTANRLDDGLAVFYNASGEWHNCIDNASVAADKDAGEALLKSASVAKNALVVVGPYLIDVEQQGSHIVPVRYREMIRTKGPSVRPDLGYQAK